MKINLPNENKDIHAEHYDILQRKIKMSILLFG